MKKSALVLACIIFLLNLQAQQAGNLKMSEYIGVNSNVAAYDQRYLADLARCTKWIREYHSWAHYEAANDYYTGTYLVNITSGNFHKSEKVLINK